MLFCGQCGFKLNSGDTQCPRCGTPVEPGAPLEDDAQPDAPTVASPSLLGNMQPQAPEKLILRPDQNTDNATYGTQAAYEATRRMEAPEQGYRAPSNSGISPSHPADFQTHYSQNNSAYPPQDLYGEYPQGGSNYAPQPQGAPYPGPSQQSYQPYPVQERRPTLNVRGRNTALLMILFGLLLILTAMVLFIMERNNVLGFVGYAIVMLSSANV